MSMCSHVRPPRECKSHYSSNLLCYFNRPTKRSRSVALASHIQIKLLEIKPKPSFSSFSSSSSSCLSSFFYSDINANVIQTIVYPSRTFFLFPFPCTLNRLIEIDSLYLATILTFSRFHIPPFRIQLFFFNQSIDISSFFLFLSFNELDTSSAFVRIRNNVDSNNKTTYLQLNQTHTQTLSRTVTLSGLSPFFFNSNAHFSPDHVSCLHSIMDASNVLFQVHLRTESKCAPTHQYHERTLAFLFCRFLQKRYASVSFRYSRSASLYPSFKSKSPSFCSYLF